MSRPPLEVADLARAASTAFLDRSRHWIRWTHRRNKPNFWATSC